MDTPLMVEIIAYAPTAFYHCTHCEVAWREVGVSNHMHEEQIQSSLPPDLLFEYQAVSNWVSELFKQHCDNVIVKVIDAASIEGFIKSIRYRARKFPAIIINRQAHFDSGDYQSAGEEIDRILAVNLTSSG